MGADTSVDVGECMGMNLGIGVNRDTTNIGYPPIRSRFRF